MSTTTINKEGIVPNVGPTELIIVLIIALVVLGPKRLPQAARSLGEGMREFKDSISEATRSEDPAPSERS